MKQTISIQTIRREIERRLEQYKRMKPEGAKWLDDAISIVNDVCDPYCPPAEEEADATGYQASPQLTLAERFRAVAGKS